MEMKKDTREYRGKIAFLVRSGCNKWSFDKIKNDFPLKFGEYLRLQYVIHLDEVHWQIVSLPASVV